MLTEQLLTNTKVCQLNVLTDKKLSLFLAEICLWACPVYPVYKLEIRWTSVAFRCFFDYKLQVNLFQLNFIRELKSILSLPSHICFIDGIDYVYKDSSFNNVIHIYMPHVTKLLLHFSTYVGDVSLNKNALKPTTPTEKPTSCNKIISVQLMLRIKCYYTRGANRSTVASIWSSAILAPGLFMELMHCSNKVYYYTPCGNILIKGLDIVMLHKPRLVNTLSKIMYLHRIPFNIGYTCSSGARERIICMPKTFN